MPTQPRSSEGCWTCRLRRKKCDEIKPICAACDALEISCLYSDTKPEWMDGAEKQSQKADNIKAEVKIKAAWRRERKHLQSIESGIEDMSMTNDTGAETGSSAQVASSARRSNSRPVDKSSAVQGPATVVGSSPGTSGNGESVSHSETSGNSLWGASPSQSSVLENQNTPMSSSAEPQLPCGHVLIGQSEHELNFIMLYLDYVFPFLFPFYRPAMLDTGRGWLLVLLTRKKTLFHSAMSLASYFFAVVVDNTTEGNEHEMCKLRNKAELEKQQELTLKELQNDVNEVNTRGVQGNLVESARIMESIIQLMTFEVAISRTGTWQMHLDGAYVMFEQIMKYHALTPGGTYCWDFLMTHLGRNAQYGKLAGFGERTPYSADQAAFRFFTSLLLFADVISSTALEQSPRLLKFHADSMEPIPAHVYSLTGLDPGKESSGAQLKLEEVVGVQNWVIIQIGQIAALHSWKQEMKKAGSLSMVQLVTRASQIETALRGHIDTIALEELCSLDPNEATFPFSLANPIDVVAQYNHGLPISNAARIAWTTRIWAQAALTYLSAVVSGWQPSSAEIKDSVAITIAFFAKMPAPAMLRTVVWPFCVTGCLALPEQEHVFRELVIGMGALSSFGTVREALGIMENVWKNRENIDATPDWNLATSLRTLGTGVILM